ncbi:ExbD/TolR family protein [Mariprofundus ferrooxydans]|uniref:Biopolymer transport protein n=1 Tax=Mariprofundus ferrooxydans PV-1 TaxID=314345 RepID=Q0F0P3_9PROT|nr:biopolymer transporter ExbD [Mariprofundus ferrooxydans]EAU54985.1 Biopolymer transport protein [Mariprofundus ferrooxydans PV-1]KON48470.1 biopolymer transporter [Mariprofundus ferrooxydans]
MNLRQKKRPDYMVDIAPLIDVVFLMLIFFMVSTTFNVTSSLKLELPSSHATAQQKEVKQLTIAINADGKLFVQDKPVADSELRSRILNATHGDPNMRVVLRADSESHHKRTVFVLDTLQGLNISKIGIATISPDDQGNQ